jgi:hypothetical protein
MRNRGRTVRRVSLILIALAVIGLASAKLVTALSPRSWSFGTLTATLEAVGGPKGARPRPLSGTITATTDHGVMTFSVGASGRHTVHPAVGIYRVSAESPQYEGGTATCHAPRTVTVSKGRTSYVTINCPEK